MRTKCQVCKMSSQCSGKLMSWWNVKLTTWQEVKLLKWQINKMGRWQNNKLDQMPSWQNVHYTKCYIDEMTKYQLSYQLLLRRAPLFQKWVEELSAEWWVHDSSKRQLVRLVVVRSFASRAFVALTLKLAQTPLAEAFCLALFKHRIQWLKQIIPLHLTT